MFAAVGVAEVRALEAAVAALCAALDPESIPLPDVPVVFGSVVAMRKAIAGAEIRLARRVEECRVWQRTGAANAAEYLAKAGGTSTAAARNALATSQKMRECAELEAAVAAGQLSEPQATVIADTAAAAPGVAAGLVGRAGQVSLGELRDECARVKAAVVDPADTERRIHARRSLRDYVDGEGAWQLHARGTVADGAKVRAVLQPIVDELFTAARRDRRREPHDAYAFDALVELADRANGTGHPSTRKRRSARHLSLIRVDFQALRRGTLEGDEVCEIAGLGPVSVPVVREMLGDSILKLVITRGVDVNVTHLGRGLTAAQQIAQWWLQPACTNLGCPRRVRLENDHRTSYAETGETSLANNDPLCDHDHDLKTYRGWALVPGTGRRPLVPADDPRHPNNANAPPAHHPEPDPIAHASDQLALV